MKVEGENAHHMVEACFKAFGRALRKAVRIEAMRCPRPRGGCWHDHRPDRYRCANIASVRFALDRARLDHVVVTEPAGAADCDRIICPVSARQDRRWSVSGHAAGLTRCLATGVPP